MNRELVRVFIFCNVCDLWIICMYLLNSEHNECVLNMSQSTSISSGVCA